MINEINELAWRDLEKTLPLYGSINARLILESVELYIGIDHDGYRHLLIVLDDLSDAFDDRRSRGLIVQGRLLTVNSSAERPFLDVMCSDKDGHKVFNMVVNDILQKLLRGAIYKDAVVSTIERWRKFWGGGLKKVLSEEQIKGLFGELWFMHFWLLPKRIDFLENWVGPQGARHDFEWQNVSIEAKTTSSVRGHIHRIHGIEQLDPPENGILYVYSLRIRKEGTAQNNLPLLIQKITTLLDPYPRLLELFEVRLSEAGYSPAHSDIYEGYRFRIIDERLYLVNSLFPRLTIDLLREGLPNGVERVDYDVNLEVCLDNIVTRFPHEFELVLQ